MPMAALFCFQGELDCLSTPHEHLSGSQAEQRVDPPGEEPLRGRRHVQTARNPLVYQATRLRRLVWIQGVPVGYL